MEQHFTSSLFSVCDVFSYFFLCQAYLLGCSFDTWSPGALSLSYVIVLMILGYFIPLLIICSCYTGIYLSARKSRVTVTKRKNSKANAGGKTLKAALTEHKGSLMTDGNFPGAIALGE